MGVVISRRIAFINEKGGSGKTTLTANIAAYLALRRGRRVLAIDMDPQGQLGKVLGVDVRNARRSVIDLLLDMTLGSEAAGEAALDRTPGSRSSAAAASRLPLLPTRIRNVDVVIANKALGLAPGWEKEAGSDPTRRLANALDEANETARYDFVLIDAPPSFGPLTLNVLRAVEEIVVPVPLTYLGLDGCAELTRTISTVRSRYDHPDLRITMVIPTFYRHTRLANELLDRLKSRFPKEIAHTVLGFHVRVDEAQARGLSIFEHAPRDRAATAIAALAEECELRERVPGEPA